MPSALAPGSASLPFPRVCSAERALPGSGGEGTHALDNYDIVWTTPSVDAAGSMPIGNGEVVLNVWVEEATGDLLFYIARSDALSEISRILKLGRIRVHFDGSPFKKAADFSQHLHLRDGNIEFSGGGLELTLFVDSDSNVVFLKGHSNYPETVSATVECWRNEPRTLPKDEMVSAWSVHDAPFPLVESADAFASAQNQVVWYHRNETSVVPKVLQEQSLVGLKGTWDPLIHRTFGGIMEGFQAEQGTSAGIARPVTDDSSGGTRVGGRRDTLGPMLAPMGGQGQRFQLAPSANNSIQSTPTISFTLRIATGSSQEPSAAAWKAKVEAEASKANFEQAATRTKKWWNAFWDRSWVMAPSPTDSASVAHMKAIESTRSNSLLTEDEQSIPNAPSDSSLADGRGTALNTQLAEGRGTAPSTQLADGRGTALSTQLAEGRGTALNTHLAEGRGTALNTQLAEGRGTALSTQLAEGQEERKSARRTDRSGVRRAQLSLGRWSGEQSSPDQRLTQVFTSYILQRYVQACQNRGLYPAKFNGGYYTVEPKAMGKDFNADYRAWGDSQWYQNVRHIVAPMAAQGDFDMMEPFFHLYEQARPLAEARSKLYHNTEGAYFPETITPFGTYSGGDYGWDRTGHSSADVLCPWWQYAWNQGLELVSLMLDRWDYTQDKEFLQKRALPMAVSVLRYFDTRFKRDSQGKIVLDPTQSVETYWTGVINDMPSSAGLISDTERLCALPPSLLSKAESQFFNRMRKACPDLPYQTEKGEKELAPAQKYDPHRSNVENPELYAIWPFRLVTLAHPDLLPFGLTAYKNRKEHLDVGWGYDGNAAALLGLADEAKRILLVKCANSHPGYRWPATWGPNFDWLPDQNHGGNLLNTTNLMLMQAEPIEQGGAIRLLPAWPKDWDVDFKLRAPGNTVVHCVYQSGRITLLDVEPASRRKDVVLQNG